MRDQANSSAAIAASESFQPFGEPEAKTGAPSVLGYTGALAGPEGMVYEQARYYDPATAQFITPDSVIPNGPGTQGYGLYGYTENDPATLSDPSGHFADLIEPLEGAGTESQTAYLGAQIAWRVYSMAIRASVLAGSISVGPISYELQSTADEGVSNSAAEAAAMAAGEVPYDLAPLAPDLSSVTAAQEDYTMEAVKQLLGGDLTDVSRGESGGLDFNALYKGEKIFIDPMGNVRASEFWDSQETTVLEQISDHVTKVGQNGFVPLDLRGFTPEQIATVEQYISSNLTLAQQEQIIRIGF